MKGLISTLAALALISSSVTGIIPVANIGNTVAAAEETGSKEYTFESAKRTESKDGLQFEIYDGYASLKYVSDKDIEEFTVPETISGLPVVGFEFGAFRDCEKLKKLTLSKNIAVLNWLEIAEAAMNEIAVTEDNENFTVIDGILYTKDKKTLVACPPESGITEVKLPAETEKIASGAFVCCKTLKKVEMTDNVKTIEQCVFFGCEALESINLSNSLTHIYPYTFAGCFALKELTIPESVDTIENPAFTDAGCVVKDGGIHYVDNWAVASDPDIQRADIREGTVGTAAGMCVSRNHLRVITVPASVKHVGMYLAFGLKMPLELVEFYNNVIPARCIGCLNVKEVHVFDPDCKIDDDNMSIPSYWREYTYTDVEDEVEEPLDYTLSHSVSKVSSSGSGSKTIFVSANTSLIDLDETKPDKNESSSVWVVGDNTISGSSDNLPKVYHAPIKKGNPARYDTVIRGVKGSTAEAYALKYRRIFEEFEPLNTLVGPDIYDDEESGALYWIYGKSHASVRLKGTANADVKDVVIPETVKGVPVTTFVVNCNMKAGKVTLPSTITTFKVSPDLMMDNTSYYEVSKDNQYFTSVDGIIYTKDMTELVKVPSNYEADEIVVPDGVKTIRSGAFHSLKYVKTVKLPDSVEVIGRNAFVGSQKLKKIEMPEKLDIICDGAFLSCTALEDVKIPDSVKHIGYQAFYEVPAVKFDGGLGYLDNWLVDIKYDHYIDVAPREGTVGIARIRVSGQLVVPKSVTKMSWEMVYSHEDILSRADVYSHVIDFDAFKNAIYMKDIYIYDPECEICAGDQTIPAKHLEYKYDSGIEGLQMPPMVYSSARTLADRLEETNTYKLADTVIHGYKGSTAEAYAKMYGIKFVEIGAETYEKGDINGNGSFNVGDLILMNRYIHGTYKFTKEQFEAADMNGDNSVDVFDVVEFRKELLK
ncbi:MAG: leucine-rich repeat protein [Ruminococcus sp.]|uniref:leucine-rich repeat protein n=1 Tax=Ruminococcus sp. TaxID=41978 RepID=UPI0025FE13E9|nr:leucine-rich repeat protein [Ruminococcus sp.]MCR5599835.1 leucine-rich repeat protein [Ruminococcus sp.]